MPIVAKSDQSTGNQAFCSIVTRSKDLVFVFSAAYSQQHYQTLSKQADAEGQAKLKGPHPGFSHTIVHDFLNSHGLGVRAVAVLVADAADAYRKAVDGGGEGVLKPTVIDAKDGKGSCTISEVKLYGEVVLRLISKTADYSDVFDIPGYEAVPAGQQKQCSFGLTRLDHAVGNVPDLLQTTNYIANVSGRQRAGAEGRVCGMSLSMSCRGGDA
eukprot:scaffold1588_cov408-Prasinococcus_capsulatus_cf.AAC.5